MFGAPSQWMYETAGGSFYDYTLPGSTLFYSGNATAANGTPTSARKFTLSYWLKNQSDANLASSGDYNTFGWDATFKNTTYTNIHTGAGGGTSYGQFQLFQPNTGAQLYLRPTRKFRDNGAWYHFVIAVDNTIGGTVADRAKMWVNGEYITDWQNHVCAANIDYYFLISGRSFSIGNGGTYGNGRVQLCEMHKIDGQQLDETYFGEFKNGVWVPKEYTGTYGNNGAYYKFYGANPLNDSSGNGRHLSGGSQIQMSDSPTQNFCVVNSPQYNEYKSAEGSTLIGMPSGVYLSYGTHSFRSGKWYWEMRNETAGNDGVAPGIKDATYRHYNSRYVTYDGFPQTIFKLASGAVYSGSTLVTALTGHDHNTVGDIVGIAVDADNNTIQWSINGGSFSSPVSITANRRWVPFQHDNSNSTFYGSMNFGGNGTFGGNVTSQGNSDANGYGDFYYAPPSGYLALCSQNQSLSSAMDYAKDGGPNKHVKVVEYAGDNTNSSAGTGGQSITGVGFRPDFVFTKVLTSSYNGVIADTARGTDANGYELLSPGGTSAELDATWRNNYGEIVAFNADGFSVNAGVNPAGGKNVNTSGENYRALCFKGSGTTVSNTSGTITSTVCANQDAGFSAVAYTGNGTTGATIGHGLSQAPEFVIIKRRNTTGNWRIYNDQGGPTVNMFFNSNIVETGSSLFNNTSPTSSVITLGPSSVADVNASGSTYVAYCWHRVEGFMEMGTYIGTSGSYRPIMNWCGFRPELIWLKGRNISSYWLEWNAEANTYNRTGYNVLYPTRALGEFEATTANYMVDLLSQGFLVNTANNSDTFADGYEYLWVAWAKHPSKYGNAH